MSNLEVSVLDISISKTHPTLQCVLSIGGKSVSVGFPSAPVCFRGVDLEEEDTLTILVTDTISEIGRVGISLHSMLGSSKDSSSGVFSLTRPMGPSPAKIHVKVSRSSNKDPPLKVEDLASSETNHLKYMLEESLNIRKDLQLRMQKSVEKFEEKHQTIENLLRNSHQETTDLREQLSQEEFEKRELLVQNEELKNKVAQLEAEACIYLSKFRTESEVTRFNQTTRSMLEESNMEKNALMKTYQNSLNEFSRCTLDQSSQMENLNKENTKVRERNCQLEIEVSSLKDENERLKNELLSLKAQLAAHASSSHLLSSQEDRIHELTSQLENYASLSQSLQEDLRTVKDSQNKQLSELTRSYNEILSKYNQMSEGMSRLQADLNAKQQENYALKLDKQEMIKDLIKLEEETQANANSRQMVEQLKFQNKLSEQERDKLASDVKQLTDTVNMQYKSIHDANKTLDSLENAHKIKESENNNLKSMIFRLKSKKPFYIPDKNDPVDIALADYLNTTNPTLKVPVQREDSGVYIFGTKRVFVKLEHGKLIFRVGGGFMQVEDFVELYSSAELERYENLLRDKAQQVRHTIYGKYAGSLITDKRREISPAHSSVKDLNHARKFTTYYGVPKKNSSPLKSSVSPRANKNRGNHETFKF